MRSRNGPRPAPAVGWCGKKWRWEDPRETGCRAFSSCCCHLGEGWGVLVLPGLSSSKEDNAQLLDLAKWVPPASSRTSLQPVASAAPLFAYSCLQWDLNFLLHFLSFLQLCDIPPLNWCCLPTSTSTPLNLSVFCCRALLCMRVKIQTLSLKNFYYSLFVDDSSFNTVPQLDLIELIWCKVTARKNKTVPSILMKGSAIWSGCCSVVSYCMSMEPLKLWVLLV